MTDARTVTKALGGKWHSSGDYGLACCPAHDDKNPSLSICDGEEELIVKCHAGCAWRDVKDALRQRGLLDSFAPGQPQPCRPLQKQVRDEEGERKRIELVLALWEPSVSLRDTIAWKYLTERRQLHVGVLDDLSHCLRWNARVNAMIGLMTDAVTGERTGLHRTYLNPRDGTKRARQMLGKRGVIRLSPDEDVETHLGIAEGVEDGLRILLSGYQPVWVATCADGIKSFPVVSGIEALTVFADNDEPGIEAAEVCVRRWIQAGRRAVICTPRKYEMAKDWDEAGLAGEDPNEAQAEAWKKFEEQSQAKPEGKPQLGPQGKPKAENKSANGPDNDKTDLDFNLAEIAAATRGEILGKRVAAPDRGCDAADRSLWAVITKSGLKSNNLKYVHECLTAYRQRKANVQERENESAPTDNENAKASTIQVQAGILHDLATEAEAALIKANAPFYVWGEQIVRPVREEVEAADGRKTISARLVTVTEAMLVDHLSRSARWERLDGRAKKYVTADPPRTVAAIIISRDGDWAFPSLAGVITTPTMRPDGSVLSKPGYDPETRLLLIDPPPLPPIPEQPTRADAATALALLESLLVEFPFVDEASKAVALSALITPVVRGAMKVSPLHGVGAPIPGTGKSYLIDLASVITTGERCPVIAAAKREEETTKRLEAAVLKGFPLISIDNLSGPLSGDALCQIIERPRLAIRVLGLSKVITVENRATLFATGNNLLMTGDVVRRSLTCTLDPNLERPELRQFKGEPVAAVLANRGKYVAAAMIIVRAFLASGENDSATPLASFEDWSHTVRASLMWLGKADPVATIEAARSEDPESLALESVLSGWQKAAGFDNPLTAGEIKKLGDSHAELRQALLDVAEWKGEIDSKRLAHFFRKYKNRIVNGVKLVARYDTDMKQKRWELKKIPAEGKGA